MRRTETAEINLGFVGLCICICCM